MYALCCNWLQCAKAIEAVAWSVAASSRAIAPCSSYKLLLVDAGLQAISSCCFIVRGPQAVPLPLLGPDAAHLWQLIFLLLFSIPAAMLACWVWDIAWCLTQSFIDSLCVPRWCPLPEHAVKHSCGVSSCDQHPSSQLATSAGHAEGAGAF